MIIRVGLENGYQGQSLAWALDAPGCFVTGVDGSTAVMNMPRAVLRYAEWVNSHTAEPWLQLDDFDIRLVETYQVYFINERYEVSEKGLEINAFFRDDWRPLDHEEIERGLQLLAWSRADLLDLLAPYPDARLDAAQPGERWSLRGILAHIATAEWWYLDRFGLAQAARSDLPKSPRERLDLVRAWLVAGLPQLEGSLQVFGKDGELWSPRKFLRRCLWHELDHIGHIARLLAES